MQNNDYLLLSMTVTFIVLIFVINSVNKSGRFLNWYFMCRIIID